jgi:hypothetical protein
MKSYFAVLVLLVGLLGCQGANEITGPARPESVPPGPERATAASNPRMPPVVVPQTRDTAVVATRPQPFNPCRAVSGDLERKNSPCQPCDHVTGNLKLKNKPCYED